MPGEIDLAKYSKLFVNESREYLRTLNEAMVELEKKPDDKEIVEVMFRGCHTIKGMAGMMGFETITETTHALEDLLNAIRNHKVEPTGDAAEMIFKALDALEGMIASVEKGEQVKQNCQKEASQESIYIQKEQEERRRDACPNEEVGHIRQICQAMFIPRSAGVRHTEGDLKDGYNHQIDALRG
jgi:chemotaxis protein histidine kinase CheA